MRTLPIIITLSHLRVLHDAFLEAFLKVPNKVVFSHVTTFFISSVPCKRIKYNFEAKCRNVIKLSFKNEGHKAVEPKDTNKQMNKVFTLLKRFIFSFHLV